MGIFGKAKDELVVEDDYIAVLAMILEIHRRDEKFGVCNSGFLEQRRNLACPVGLDDLTRNRVTHERCQLAEPVLQHSSRKQEFLVLRDRSWFPAP
jgi:hypothetical protein